MNTNTIITAYSTSLASSSGENVIITSATPQELSEREGIDKKIYAIRTKTSRVTAYKEAWRAASEVQMLEIMTFVKTLDTHTDRDNAHKAMTDMKDAVTSWLLALDNSTISSDIEYTKYLGVHNVVDDKPGYYSLTQRMEFEVCL